MAKGAYGKCNATVSIEYAKTKSTRSAGEKVELQDGPAKDA